MAESSHLEVFAEIESSKQIAELLLIQAGITRSEEVLLAEFEEPIIDKVIELLSNPEQRYWCSVEEFQYIVAGLDSSLTAKYQEALRLAINTGIEDFAVLNKIVASLNLDQKENLDPKKIGDFLATDIMQSRINAVRGVINQGKFNQPTQKRKRRGSKAPQHPVPEIDKLPFKQIVKQLHNLSLAILSSNNHEQQLIALEIFEDLTIDKQEDRLDAINILKFAENLHPEEETRFHAQYVMEAFTSLGAYIGEEMYGYYDPNGALNVVEINPNLKEEFNETKTRALKSEIRSTVLEIIFDNPKVQSNDQKLLQDIKMLELTIDRFIKPQTATIPAYQHTFDHPTEQPLADQLIKFTLQGELTNLQKLGVFDGLVIPSQENISGNNILIIWRKNITREMIADKESSLNLINIENNLPYLLNSSATPLRTAELAAVLAFLRPEAELDTTTPLSELKNQARGGMYPISKRGISIELDDQIEQERWLLMSGLNKITFKRTTGPHSLKVDLEFGKRNFTFEINEQMQSAKLDEIATTEKEWLERVVYSYLVAIKNRDLYQTQKLRNDFSEANDQEEDQNQDVPQEKKRKETTSSSHLKVLPYSYQPKEWDDPNSEINLEVKEEIGYSLLELNLHFTLAQKDLGYLETIKDETLKRILVSSLKRLEGKVVPENWKADRVQLIQSKIKDLMTGAVLAQELRNPLDGQSPELINQDMDNIAMIGFQHEPTDPVGDPIQIKIDAVSSNLFTAS